MRVAIYPGTFDPITLGHMDIIKGAMKLTDQLVIGVAVDTMKAPLFSLEERVQMILDDIKPLQENGHDIKVKGFEGLVVNFARNNEAEILIRGLRAASDFEYEFQMSGMNAQLDSRLQTVFLPASESRHFIASRVVKEVARLDGDISKLVSSSVAKKISQSFFINLLTR